MTSLHDERISFWILSELKLFIVASTSQSNYLKTINLVVSIIKFDSVKLAILISHVEYRSDPKWLVVIQRHDS